LITENSILKWVKQAIESPSIIKDHLLLLLLLLFICVIKGGKTLFLEGVIDHHLSSDRSMLAQNAKSKRLKHEKIWVFLYKKVRNPKEAHLLNPLPT
jgi:hypothetical protein